MAIDHDIIIRILMRDRVKLLAYLWAILRDSHLAEDVLQEVGSLALHKRDEIQDEAHFLKWLRHSARYLALNAIQKRKSQPLVLDVAVLDALESRWTEYDAVPASEISDALQHCLDQLTPHARQLVGMRYGQNISGQRLADALGRNLNTVYVALARAHRTLGDCIRRRMKEVEA